MAKLVMKKIALAAMKRDRRQLVKLLQDMGCLQLVSLDMEEAGQRVPDPEEVGRLENALTLLQAALDRLAVVSPVKRSLLEQKPVLTGDQAEALLARQEEVLDACRKIRALEGRNAEIGAQTGRLAGLCAALEPIEELDAPLAQVRDTQNVHIGIYIVDNRAAQAFEEESAGLPQVTAVPIGRLQDQRYYLVAAHKQERGTQDWLRAHDAKHVVFTETDTPRQEMEKYSRDIKALEAERENNISAMRGFASYREDMEALYDVLNNAHEREVAAFNFVGTQSAFLLEGWVEEARLPQIRKALTERFPALYLEEVEPREGETAPVALRNNRLVTPYETVTNMYSAPGPRDVDPNALMMPFFIAFFGMMVSDAGYGILLSLLAVAGLKLVKPKGTIGDIAKMLALGGVLTLFWGAMFGTWFGFTTPAIMLNPLEQPLQMLILCFALGLFHMLVGMAAAAVSAIREGRVLDAIGQQFSWFAIFLGLGLIFVPGAQTAGYVALGAGVAAILLFSNNEAGWNIFKRIGSGLSSLYGVTSYLSDVLSYARLFAMGLATGVIGSVINTIVGMVWGNPIGMVFGVIIFVGGHIFNLAINALGAYVHASRLQYIEFYGKFYEGGGEVFTPLARTSRYVELH